MLQAALDYLDRGFSVIPVSDKKIPLIKWEQFQHRKPTKDEISHWFKRWPEANIGIVTGKISGITVIDSDNDQAYRMLEEFLPDSLITPISKTPHGKHHVFLYSPKLPTTTKVGGLAIDVRNDGGYVVAPPSKNDSGIYAWEIPLNGGCSAIPELLLDTILQIYGSLPPNNGNSVVPVNNDILQQGTRDNDLFHLALHLLRGRMPVDQVRSYMAFFAAHCDPPFDQKETETKIKSAMERVGRYGKSTTDEIRHWIEETTGIFSLSDLYVGQHIVSREEKNQASVILGRLIEEGLIERVGQIHGRYRRIQTDAPEIDIFSDTKDFLDIKYPLDMDWFFSTMPKNIVVYAGEPDAGKTALALNTAKLNVNHGYPIRYMSSEMGASELKLRLSKFSPDIPYETWRKINFREVVSGWQDYIIPDGINIIDYLEITEDFFMVGSLLRRIFDKLDNGVAIVCLQKKRGAELAYGAETSLKLPRLYVSISSNPPEGAVAKIIKCKNWAVENWNPNGRSCVFRLASGCRITQCTKWDYDPVKKSGSKGSN